MIPSRPVFIYREDGRLDYPAMRNAATKGTLSSRQIRAAVEKAARKAAKTAEGAKSRRRVLAPRELPNGIE
jgi:hypothetical protein